MWLTYLVISLPPLDQLTALVGLIGSCWGMVTLIRKGYREWRVEIIRREKERASLSWLEEHREELEDLVEEDRRPRKRGHR